MEYDEYLPHINVRDGKTRVMNNLKLYTSLLGKFKARPMTEELLAAIGNSDYDTVVQRAHALRGTAGNLGFPILLEVTQQIETLAKSEQDSSHLCAPLNNAVDSLEVAIKRFISVGSVL